jgi:AIG2-like family
VAFVNPPDDKAVWYFAFGANMSSRVLRARHVRPLSSEAARLDGFRLVFGEPGVPLLEPVFASIDPAEGESVYGVLLRLLAEDFTRIDATEGPGYDVLRVDVVGSVNGPVRARAFRTRDPVRGRRPSRRYLDLMRSGAREHGLPERYVQRLDAEPCGAVLPGSGTLFTALVRVLGLFQRRGLLVPWRARRRYDE